MRPRTTASRATVLLLLSLVLAALLEAEGLRKRAVAQPVGAQRSAALAVTSPLVRVSRALHLTVPRRELQEAIGRRDADVVDTRVRLVLPPPAARTQPVASTRRAQRHAAPRPVRVWVAGDSLAQVPGEALLRLAPARVTVLPIESRLSTGLARPDLFNWFTRFAEVVEDERPDVAVLSFGADDAHDYLAGVPAGRHVGPFGSPSWCAEYRRRVDGVTRELNAAGIHTVWLGLPIPDGRGFRRSFPVVNRILAQVARRHAGRSAYLDTWHLLDDAHGRFAPYLRVDGRLTRVRLPDGVHYTAAGGDLIGRALLPVVSRG